MIMNTNCRLSSDLIPARTCYRHLAGELGISIVSALEKHGYLSVHINHSGTEYLLTKYGKEWSQKLAIGSLNRVQINACMDYSHQRPHMAGAWSVDFCAFLFNQEYIMRGDIDRSVVVSPKGKSFFRDELAIEWVS